MAGQPTNSHSRGSATTQCTVERLLNAALAPSTRLAYNAHIRRFNTFTGTASFPASTAQVMCFVAYLFENGYSPSSIATHISAIAYAHKLLGAPDPTDQFIIRKLVVGATRLTSKPDSRLPITPPILTKLCTILHNMNYSYYQQTMFKAIFTLAFFAFLRIGEIAVSSGTKPNYVVQIEDVLILPSGIQLQMHNYKHSVTRHPATMHIQRQPPPICPVQALISYIKLRGTARGPLFCFPDLRPLSKVLINSNLSLVLQAAGLNPKLFKGHSFRIGAATYAASQGHTTTQIQQMGRWHSSAFQKYVRIDSIALPNTNK